MQLFSPLLRGLFLGGGLGGWWLPSGWGRHFPGGWGKASRSFLWCYWAFGFVGTIWSVPVIKERSKIDILFYYIQTKLYLICFHTPIKQILSTESGPALLKWANTTHNSCISTVGPKESVLVRNRASCISTWYFRGLIRPLLGFLSPTARGFWSLNTLVQSRQTGT